MRGVLIAAAVMLGLIVAAVGGYLLASSRFSAQQSQREQQLENELSMILSLLADIADHRDKGELEIADWKFSAAHESLDGYVRDGGPDPTQFVPDIVERTVERTEAPDRDKASSEDE